ncbi:MAG: substrate-binding domain-containing protein [Deltaproteobacteria bacterium]|nr:substrate-binding domain-containing protein [Deltaproteobacteria bacterium]
MERVNKLTKVLLGMCMAMMIVAAMPGASLADEAYVKMAKDYIKKATAPGAAWDGPTSGPKAAAGKSVVYVSADQRNGGALGVGQGAEEAAKAIGWKFRVIDGQGTVSGRTSALNQAIATKPDGIILGTVDAKEQAAAIEAAAKNGIKIVGWHSAAEAGPVKGTPVFSNVTTDPLEVAKAAAYYAVADSNGTAGVIIFTDSVYAVAIAKSDAMAAVIKKCSGCTMINIEDTPLSDTAARMPQLVTSLLQRHGKKWTYSMGVNDLYYDFAAPSFQGAGIAGNGFPRNISAGDGSGSAFQRIRKNSYQVGTVAEPLNLHGWQTIDEMNRAFAGQKDSGYVAPVHLFTPANIEHDGGAKNTYDPDNGYRNQYKKIWGK